MKGFKSFGSGLGDGVRAVTGSTTIDVSIGEGDGREAAAAECVWRSNGSAAFRRRSSLRMAWPCR